MLIETLTTTQALIDEHNKRIDDWVATETAEIYIEGAKHLRVETIEDRFCPYVKWLDQVSEEMKKNPFKVIADEVVPEGVFVTRGNEEHDFKHFIGKTLGWDLFYGVCDNGYQARQHYDKLVADEILDSNDNHVIFLVPIFRDGQPEHGGWRWHKWGKYIGVQDPGCEYLYDEENIDLVYAFGIHPVFDESEGENQCKNWQSRMSLSLSKTVGRSSK